LSVVHGIVQSFEGNILVYSEPGQGSAFHIFLPTLESAACESAEPEKRMPAGSERVLFVDDEKSILDLNETFLHSLGYTVTVCQYPLQALEMMQRDPHRFDIVITDLTMPKMTGLQLAGKIFEIRQDIPILLSTGFSSPVDEQTAQAMGIKAVIQKPILIRELADKIRTVLSV
jgi:CheY-like chemotaxis protein